MADGDRSGGRGDDAPGVAPRCDGGARVGRNEPAHRVVERDLPFLDEHHDGDGRERLGLRGDAEHRVGCHASPAFLVRPADRALVRDLAIAEHQRDRARDAIAVHVLLEKAVDPMKPRGGEPVFERGIASGCCLADGGAGENDEQEGGDTHGLSLVTMVRCLWRHQQ